LPTYDYWKPNNVARNNTLIKNSYPHTHKTHTRNWKQKLKMKPTLGFVAA
jgi:hypothetical protein